MEDLSVNAFFTFVDKFQDGFSAYRRKLPFKHPDARSLV
jgi:hypothetical protein